LSVSAVFDGGLFKITDAFPCLLNPGWRKLDFSHSYCSSRKGRRRFFEALEGSETWSGQFTAMLGRYGISRFRCHRGPIEWEMGNGSQRRLPSPAQVCVSGDMKRPRKIQPGEQWLCQKTVARKVREPDPRPSPSVKGIASLSLSFRAHAHLGLNLLAISRLESLRVASG
jgi:hypothetical protein